jgi:hypothetical protein
MVNKKKKSSKSKNRRTRVIFGREKSQDALARAIIKVCKEAGIKIIPEKKKKK